jgi:hypothetical protein
MNSIQVPRRLLQRRQFLQLSGLSSIGLLLNGCGSSLFEEIVGKSLNLSTRVLKLYC